MVALFIGGKDHTVAPQPYVGNAKLVGQHGCGVSQRRDFQDRPTVGRELVFDFGFVTENAALRQKKRAVGSDRQRSGKVAGVENLLEGFGSIALAVDPAIVIVIKQFVDLVATAGEDAVVRCHIQRSSTNSKFLVVIWGIRRPDRVWPFPFAEQLESSSTREPRKFAHRFVKIWPFFRISADFAGVWRREPSEPESPQPFVYQGFHCEINGAA